MSVLEGIAQGAQGVAAAGASIKLAHDAIAGAIDKLPVAQDEATGGPAKRASEQHALNVKEPAEALAKDPNTSLEDRKRANKIADEADTTLENGKDLEEKARKSRVGVIVNAVLRAAGGQAGATTKANTAVYQINAQALNDIGNRTRDAKATKDEKMAISSPPAQPSGGLSDINATSPGLEASGQGNVIRASTEPNVGPSRSGRATARSDSNGFNSGGRIEQGRGRGRF